MTIEITLIHIWIFHSFNKFILTNLQQIEHETPPWVFVLFFQQLTTYNIHDLTGITTPNDFLQHLWPYEILRHF